MLTTAVALLAILTGIGEPFWLGFVGFWMIYPIVRRWPFPVSGLLLAAGVAVIWGHSEGYKLCGSPRIVDNRPLLQKDAWVFHHAESPNIVVATDGSKHAVTGIAFASESLLDPQEFHPADFCRDGKPFRFTRDLNTPSGYIAEVRISYWCGNTFFPVLLPRRLRSHSLQDMAQALKNLQSMPSTVAKR